MWTVQYICKYVVTCLGPRVTAEPTHIVVRTGHNSYLGPSAAKLRQVYIYTYSIVARFQAIASCM